MNKKADLFGIDPRIINRLFAILLLISAGALIIRDFVPSVQSNIPSWLFPIAPIVLSITLIWLSIMMIWDPSSRFDIGSIQAETINRILAFIALVSAGILIAREFIPSVTQGIPDVVWPVAPIVSAVIGFFLALVSLIEPPDRP